MSLRWFSRSSVTVSRLQSRCRTQWKNGALLRACSTNRFIKLQFQIKLVAKAQVKLKAWDDWTDPDFFTEGKQTEKRPIRFFLRQLASTNLQQTKLTITGWMLIFVALGIGSAAYNTASNILFMTLSLLLSSLVLSGILSLINFKKLDWSL